jgi:hypothetical protein
MVTHVSVEAGGPGHKSCWGGVVIKSPKELGNSQTPNYFLTPKIAVVEGLMDASGAVDER